jgi:hypothetical protein
MRTSKQEVRFSPLQTCEDSFEPTPVSPASVICLNLWGALGHVKMKRLAAEHNLKVRDYGLTERGVSIRFYHRRDAAIFRMFYPGETEAGDGA